jgi:hypothetical protein
MKPIFPIALVAGAACIVALSCGDVPTFANGIVSISAVLLPSPAVAAGDQLRDSTGAVAPITIVAYDKDNNVIPGVAATFIVSTVPVGATIDANGILTAKDSIGPLQVVGRVGASIQTAPISLQVVAQPDSIVQDSSVADSLLAFKLSTLQVRVTGLRGGIEIPVPGIIVRYQITKMNGSPVVDSTQVELLDDTTNPLRSDSRQAVDTTDSGGLASRFLLPNSVTLVSVEIHATATNLRGVALPGSPVVFIITKH